MFEVDSLGIFSLLPGQGTHYVHEPGVEDDGFKISFLRKESPSIEGEDLIHVRKDLLEDLYCTSSSAGKLLEY